MVLSGLFSANRVTENKSTKELAAMLSNTTITELASVSNKEGQHCHDKTR